MTAGDSITGQTYFERGKPVAVSTGWREGGPCNVLIQRNDGSRSCCLSEDFADGQVKRPPTHRRGTSDDAT
jgi:hypothetical protein